MRRRCLSWPALLVKLSPHTGHSRQSTGLRLRGLWFEASSEDEDEDEDDDDVVDDDDDDDDDEDGGGGSGAEEDETGARSAARSLV